MQKIKLIAIIGGAVILVFLVLISLSGYFSSQRNSGRMPLGAGFEAPMSAGMPSDTSRSNLMPGSGGVQEKMLAQDSISTTDYSPTPETDPTDVDKKVIKDGNLTMKVDKVDGAVLKIEKIAKDNGGDMFSSNFFQNSQEQKSGTISVKVPVANFEKTFNELKKVASVVVRESTSGQDVTREYQDLEGRIKNKQAEEQAYQKVLDQAQKISDILEATQALSRVRGEIESLQGTLRYLSAQTDMSTITASLSEDSNITISDSWRPVQVAKEAVRSLVVKAQNFVDFLIIFLITFLPTFALYLLLAWVVYKIGRGIFVKLYKNKTDKVA
jgi:hypothetical protein